MRLGLAGDARSPRVRTGATTPPTKTGLSVAHPAVPSRLDALQYTASGEAAMRGIPTRTYPAPGTTRRPARDWTPRRFGPDVARLSARVPRGASARSTAPEGRFTRAARRRRTRRGRASRNAGHGGEVLEGGPGSGPVGGRVEPAARGCARRRRERRRRRGSPRRRRRSTREVCDGSEMVTERPGLLTGCRAAADWAAGARRFAARPGSAAARPRHGTRRRRHCATSRHDLPGSNPPAGTETGTPSVVAAYPKSYST